MLVIVTTNIVSSVFRRYIDFNVSNVSISSVTKFLGNSNFSITVKISLSLTHCIAIAISDLKSWDNCSPVSFPLKNVKSIPISSTLVKAKSNPIGKNTCNNLESKVKQNNVSTSVNTWSSRSFTNAIISTEPNSWAKFLTSSIEVKSKSSNKTPIWRIMLPYNVTSSKLTSANSSTVNVCSIPRFNVGNT